MGPCFENNQFILICLIGWESKGEMVHKVDDTLVLYQKVCQTD